MSNLPGGIVTFLFTDIEGSTPLFQKFPDAMPRALARHHEILQETIAQHNGRVFQIIGDAFCAAFENTQDGLSAALDAQRALSHENWGEIGALRVRMGLHTGEANARGDDYVSSLTLVRAQRFMHAGHGGQILLSEPAAERVRANLPGGTTLRELGVQKLRGLQQPEAIFQLVASDLPSVFPPLRVAEAASAQDTTTLLDQLVRGKLIGRAAQVQELKQHWHTAQQARAHLVTLSGEPGIGKTRLANELIGFAQSDGATILRGGCYEYEAATPYLPFVEALRDWVHSQSAETLRAFLNSTASEIAKLAPEVHGKLGDIPANPPLPPNEERLRLFDTVARLFQKIASARGLLLFMDDLHWADQSTLSLLHYLLRHLQNDRVLFLAAYREIELDRQHPLAAALVEWTREHLATRLSLARLSRADTGILLASLFGMTTISEEFVAVMYRETEGNPFFIEQVVKALIEQGQIYREHGGWGRREIHELAIPQSVKEAIGRRLNRLSETCAEVLRTAAALGKTFYFDQLAAVSVIDEDRVLDSLDEAASAQLIHAEAGDAYAFTHDKIREVLYEEMNAIRRRRLHQRIGEILEQRFLTLPASRVRGDGYSAQDLAYHFTESGDLERALNYSRQAAENAVRVFALEEALAYLKRAREAAEALNQNETLAQIDEAMGDIYSMQSFTPAAVEHYTRAESFTHETTARGALHAKIGRDYAQVGDARGERYLEMALTELDAQTQTNELALATAALARFHHYRAQHRRALEFLQRALELGERTTDPMLLHYLYLYHSGAYQHLMRLNESIAWANKAIELGEREKYLPSIATGYEFLGEDAQIQGRWREALEYARRDREIGTRVGGQDRVAWSNYIDAMSYQGLGNLAAAEQAARAGIALGDALGDTRVAIMTQGVLAEVLADGGKFQEAHLIATQAVARSNELQHLVIQAQSHQATGYVYAMQREYARAVEWFEQAAQLLAPSDNQLARLRVAPAFAEAYCGAGDLERARRLAQDAIALAQFSDAPHWEGWAARVKGQIFVAQENFEDAQRAFDFAIEVLTQTESILQLAFALYHRALFWRARGDMTNAAADMERAGVLFAECGAQNPGESAF